MIAGLIIEYRYEGDEEAWRESVSQFVSNAKADESLNGKFNYIVMKTKADPKNRVHIPRWDSEETLKYVQSQEWFKTFAAKVKEFAGDSLNVTPISAEFDSSI